MFEVEYFTLDSTEATNKFIELGGVPVSSTNVALDLIGGSAQALTGDFAIDGTNIKWDSTSYDLYLLLTTGDKLRVIYDKS